VPAKKTKSSENSEEMSERFLIFGLVVAAILLTSVYQISREIKLEETFTEEIVAERQIVLGILA